MGANPHISSPETHQGSKGPAEGHTQPLAWPKWPEATGSVGPRVSRALTDLTYTHKMAAGAQALAGQSLAETLLCLLVSWGV